jgi:tetratricopeptide (TPR) repeat protein
MAQLSSVERVVRNIRDLLQRKLFVLAREQALDALAESPNNLDLRVILAQVCYDGQDYLTAANTMEQALTIAPEEPEFIRMASLAWAQAGIVDRGLELADKYKVVSGTSPQAWQLLGNIYEKTGRVEDAWEAMGHVPRTDAYMEILTLIEARLLYADKEYGKSIDMIRDYHAWAEKARGSAHPPDDDFYIDSWFQLAKVHNKVGEYDEAWAAASHAHDIADQTWDQDRFDNDMASIREFFTAETLASLAHATDPFEQPVFVVGNARSGTSLLEQILSMHPDVGNGGEMMVTLGIQRRLQTMTDSFHTWPDCVVDMRVEDANACSREYRDATQWFSVGKKRVTNKSIGLQTQVGFLSLMLPQSRVIMLHRHPLDNCLSCFTTNLVHSGHPYTRSIESLGRTWVTRRIMQDYWTDVVETPVMQLHYDRLVVDQENETRRLLEFLDLPWEDECMEFHKSTRVAATISYDQVNQKMYTSSSGRWKNYEKHLGPLIDIVADYL